MLVKKMMMCGSDGRARMEKRTRKEAKWQRRTRQDRNLVSRVGHFAHGAAQGGATDSVHCRVWCNHKILPIYSVQTLWMFRKVQWIGSGRCLVVMYWLFPTIQNEKKSLSPSESFAKNQIACSVRLVLCELRLGSKPRSMSSLLHYLLCSLLFCNLFPERNFLFPNIFSFDCFFFFQNIFCIHWRNICFGWKRTVVCALCCWSLFFEFSISCWYIWKLFFTKKNFSVAVISRIFLRLFLPLLFSHLFLIVVWSVVAVAWTSAAGHPLHPDFFLCAIPFVFSFFLFFYDKNYWILPSFVFIFDHF